jgi:hypothetical protein
MGLNYDGTYVGVSVVNNSAGNTWTSGGSQPCVTEPAPILVISRGRAQFPWQGYTLIGNVTPSGALIMTSTFGQVFEGSINSQYRITGQVTGYCYELTWQKAELIQAGYRAGRGSRSNTLRSSATWCQSRPDPHRGPRTRNRPSERASGKLWCRRRNAPPSLLDSRPT